MIDENALFRQHILNSLNFAFIHNTYAVLVPEQAKILYLLLSDSAACACDDEYDDHPARGPQCKGCEDASASCNVRWDAVLNTAGSVQSKEPCCLTCKFWFDPGRPVPISNCTRLVLANDDQVTPVENIVGYINDFFLNVPADFLCKYYEPKDLDPKKKFYLDLSQKTSSWFPSRDLSGVSN